MFEKFLKIFGRSRDTELKHNQSKDLYYYGLKYPLTVMDSYLKYGKAIQASQGGCYLVLLIAKVE